MIPYDKIMAKASVIQEATNTKQKIKLVDQLMSEILDEAPPIVELHPAFVWDCENCGKENFCRSIATYLQPGKDDVQLEKMYGADALEEIKRAGGFITCKSYPFRVTCTDCTSSYRTVSSAVPVGEDENDGPLDDGEDT